MAFTAQFLTACILDYIFGDPRSIPHPVQLIGRFCIFYEKLTRAVTENERAAGTLAFLLVLLSALFTLYALLTTAFLISPLLGTIISIFLLYTGIAYRDLKKHTCAVYQALSDPDPTRARNELQKIVGRDTSVLDEQGICKAAVETMAENMVDGIMSPIFFAILFSLIPAGELLSPLAMAAMGIYFYKAVNTMDSMYGYKNDRYLYFGTFAARTDDVVNFIPARMSGFFIIASCFILGLDYKKSAVIFARDRLCHSSPNAGHPEAAVAGGLGIQLGGPSIYFGKTVEKPTMGDKLRSINSEDIKTANKIVFYASVLFLFALLAVRLLITGV